MSRLQYLLYLNPISDGIKDWGQLHQLQKSKLALLELILQTASEINPPPFPQYS